MVSLPIGSLAPKVISRDDVFLKLYNTRQMESSQAAEFAAALNFNETLHDFPELQSSANYVIEDLETFIVFMCSSLQYFVNLRKWARTCSFNEQNLSEHFGEEGDPRLEHLVAALDAIKDVEILSREGFVQVPKQWVEWCRLQEMGDTGTYTSDRENAWALKEADQAHAIRARVVEIEAKTLKVKATRKEYRKRIKESYNKYYESIGKIDSEFGQEIRGTEPMAVQIESFLGKGKNPGKP
ncbi:hypothetical protein K491DRAFT_709820 [Lophiostoma macrostomum CBS 122681]|uniref:Uncharacterized protein n=1 Tax=Lophiostoma macrostomum CBS 122681 TaxID=1314788 RepID=A0A6A6TSM3_9PLEO|nr:hypothetical protein K491DRAFT_709820 [Lophiostoma macrostomum CBS 122681]